MSVVVVVVVTVSVSFTVTVTGRAGLAMTLAVLCTGMSVGMGPRCPWCDLVIGMISSEVRVEGGCGSLDSEVELGTGAGGGGGGGTEEETTGGKIGGIITMVVRIAGGGDVEDRVIVSRVVEGASVTGVVPGVSFGGAMIIEVTISVGTTVTVTSKGGPLLA